MTSPTPITPELLRQALAHVPANLPRDEWARMGMAIKAEYPDAVGFELFDTWSATDADRYDPAAVRSTWRSIKAGGGVGVATLLHLAKQHGFTLPKAGQEAAAPTAAELAERDRQRAERQRQDQAATEARHAAAAAEAVAQWEAASPTGTSPYLARKGVQPHGVRFGADGWLLVPLRDAEGKLCNLQRIAPAKPANGAPEKLFLKGGRKSGLWHLLGELPPVATERPTLLLAEGYATAATLFEATGHPVAVAFDAGNLVHVARALHTAHPAALLVVCGDDDQATQAEAGTNPGRQKAMAAAKAVQGLAVFPEGLPAGGSDFNDLAAHAGDVGSAAGLQAVRQQVLQAIAAHAQAQAQPDSTKGSTPANGHSQADGVATPEWDRFSVTDGGVFHNGVDRDGQPTKPEWVCSRLDVAALTRDQYGGGWGYLLNFADPLGRPKQWPMPARMLAGDGGEYRAVLLGMGLRIATSPRARNLLTQYIQTRTPDSYATCTDRVGWHGRAFVLPQETIGDDAERIVFQSDIAQENTFGVKGTAEQWRTRVAALCAGNSRMVFAVACAFAGPLLRPAGLEGGGFHYRGDGSTGKSTAQFVASSVYGSERFKQSWKATDNAIEGLAAQHNDCIFVLDEIGEADAKLIGDVVYMLANGQGKARSTRNQMPRPRLAWRLLFLSSGEKSLADHMAEGMKRIRAGQETRMADIPADAGVGLGVFENIHGHDGGAAFSNHLKGQAATVYGAPGLAWLQWLTDNADVIKARIREASQRLASQLVPEGASGQVERVGARFALVGAAGEMATAAGLTGWAVGESERAARACFNAWLAARGGIGNGEVVTMLRQVRRFLEAHGEGRFTWWHRGHDAHSAKTLNRAGYRRLVTSSGKPISTPKEHDVEFGDPAVFEPPTDASVEFFVLSEVFKTEVCQGFDVESVAKVLKDHDCLLSDEPGRNNVKQRLPGIGSVRCYRITPAIFELDL